VNSDRKSDRPVQMLSSTASLCPVCLARIPAFREQMDEKVFLVKHCQEHGTFRTVIWRGAVPFSSWLRPKKPSAPLRSFTAIDQGCPFDCGLCPDHRQHTCTALIEITQRCNLHCPVCFADAGAGAKKSDDPSLVKIGYLYDRVLEASGSCNIQLSGGEPTVRDDLPEIIGLGRKKGFSFIQLNTNGLFLAADPNNAVSLKNAGLSSVFLQFDGLSSATHIALRGRDLTGIKEQALLNCQAAGLAVVLVPTMVPHINTHEVGAIIRYAKRFAPTVRGVHFQPVSYFGRFPEAPADEDRLTLPELMQLIDRQSGGAITAEHFAPPVCEHALCSFHGNFLVEESGNLMPLGNPGNFGNRQVACCSTGETQTEIPTALQGREKSVAFTARQWTLPMASGPSVCAGEKNTPPLEELDELDDLDRFLARARTHTFSISAMAFQDVWNLDLERLKGCCIHVVSPEGKLVPFCAYNLTSSMGKRLYRGVDLP
jgi:7,8-dihydro-6-hydroxymethylpterin dimethyltransferase